MRRDSEAGNMTISMVIIVPMLMLIGGLILLGGYLASAQGAVQAAANEAARTASLARDPGTAKRNASTTAESTLANSDAPCSSTSVGVNVDDFSQDLGVAGSVEVAVTCTVRLNVLGLPGVNPEHTARATASSTIDAYRARG